MNINTVCSLTQKEAEILARLSYEKKDIVTSRDLDEYLPKDYGYRRKLVYSLKRKKILIPIKNGVYIFVPLEAIPAGRRLNDFIIPGVFFPNNDYYIGYSTMFNYYNLISQQFQTIYVLNTRVSRERVIAGMSFKFIKITPQCLYGLENITIQGREVVISSKERTLIDLINFNEPVGGLMAAIEILKQVIKAGRCDIKKLIQLAIKFPRIKTRKCIGLVLDESGVEETLLKSLQKTIKDTALISFTKDRKGAINEKWRVILGSS